MLTLRPYQTKAVDDVRAEYLKGRTAPVLVMPTGAGKTQVAAWIIRSALERGNRTLFCAGRTELLDQTVDKLRNAGVDSVRLIQASRDVGPKDAEVTVASIQTLTTKRWADKLPPAELLILDECFPAGTLVDGRPIESLQIGDRVRSFNESTGCIELRPVRHLFCSRPSTLVTVHLDDGRAVTCTAGHPFFDGDGYTPAIQLSKGQYVFGQFQENASQLRGMRNLVSGMETGSSGDLLDGVQGNATCGSKKDSRDELRDLRNVGVGERTIRPGIRTTRTDVLLGYLQTKHAVAREFRTYDANQSQISRSPQQADDRMQPDARRGHAGPGQCVVASAEPSAAGAGRERHRTLSDGGEVAVGASVGLGRQSCGSHNAAVQVEVSCALQDRHRASADDDGSRDRRLESLRSGAASAGRQEAGLARVARVDRVEVHERRDRDGFGALYQDDLVYNIEVEGNHNYFVDGILVHNCHHGAAATWTRVLKQYPSARRLGLTATPERADGKPLGDLFDCLVTGPSVRELTDAGHLVECIVFPPAGGTRLSKAIALDPVAAYQQNGNNERAIVFCISRQHAQRTEAEFLAAGIECAVIDGTMARGARRSILARFRAGEIRVLSSIGVLTEGWDDPGCSVAILARDFGHPGLFIQCGGRVLRPHPGKTHARLIDLVGSVYEHGTLDYDGRTYSLDGTAISGVVRDTIKQCMKCGAVYRPNQRCPNCGAEQELMPFQAPAVTGEGLTQLKGPVAPPVKPEHIRTIVAKYDGRCWNCRERITAGATVLFATVARRIAHLSCERRAA